MKIKDDTVVWHRFAPEIYKILPLVDLAIEKLSSVCEETVMTSGCDGEHSVGSLHYIGRAADFSIRNIPGIDVMDIVKALKKWLGKDYNIVVESDHLHIEYDPK